MPGSSPRVWGQVCKTSAKLNELRIIPTRVGTSTVKKSEATAGEDHPHACGDKYDLKAKIWNEAGSSPRVWGQVGVIPEGTTLERIIPTRVGTSVVYISFRPKPQDHPHACGDKSTITR